MVDHDYYCAFLNKLIEAVVTPRSMDSRLVRQNGLVLILLMTLLTSSWSAMITSNDSKFAIDESIKFISHSNNDFNSSNGFLHENTSVINTTG